MERISPLNCQGYKQRGRFCLIHEGIQTTFNHGKDIFFAPDVIMGCEIDYDLGRTFLEKGLPESRVAEIDRIRLEIGSK